MNTLFWANRDPIILGKNHGGYPPDFCFLIYIVPVDWGSTDFWGKNDHVDSLDRWSLCHTILRDHGWSLGARWVPWMLPKNAQF